MEHLPNLTTTHLIIWPASKNIHHLYTRAKLEKSIVELQNSLSEAFMSSRTLNLQPVHCILEY